MVGWNAWALPGPHAPGFTEKPASLACDVFLKNALRSPRAPRETTLGGTDRPDVAGVEERLQVRGTLAGRLFLLLARERVDRGPLHRAEHAHRLRERRLERRQRHRQRQIVARLVVHQRVAGRRAHFQAEALADAQRLLLRLARPK